MEPINVLISLQRGYGLGDAVQMSAVLRHVKKYRPHWIVDFQAEEGRHQIARGLVANNFAFGQPHPSDHYEAEVQILLYDTWANWGDRPNTRVSSCLHERFGLPWDAECGQYEINVSRDAYYSAKAALSKWTARRPKLTTRSVAVHYIGDSSPDKKNLTHGQAIDICREIRELEYEPLLLDWRGQLPWQIRNKFNNTGGESFSQEWGGNAEMVCAVISQCAAFVGIDSGPSKCASATNTPALVVWTGHHPAPFHDPAPNTTHLVPDGYNGLEPVCFDRGVVEWFESHYNVRRYNIDPVREVREWLKEKLSD